MNVQRICFQSGRMVFYAIDLFAYYYFRLLQRFPTSSSECVFCTNKRSSTPFSRRQKCGNFRRNWKKVPVFALLHGDWVSLIGALWAGEVRIFCLYISTPLYWHISCTDFK